jgi:serine/threonine protein kinase
MGEVWRAHDSKLEREVAIKILPEAFATSPDRMARFAREAQVRIPGHVNNHSGDVNNGFRADVNNGFRG